MNAILPTFSYPLIVYLYGSDLIARSEAIAMVKACLPTEVILVL